MTDGLALARIEIVHDDGTRWGASGIRVPGQTSTAGAALKGGPGEEARTAILAAGAAPANS